MILLDVWARERNIYRVGLQRGFDKEIPLIFSVY